MSRSATDVPDGWVTTSEAAARLGVKRATLYAYVSRGVLRSRRRPGQQESLFDRAQIDALAGHTRQPGTPRPLLRFRSVATSVSSHRHGNLLYRGLPVEQVCAGFSIEEAARLVLGADDGAEPPMPHGEPSAAVRQVLADVPLGRRAPLAVALLGAGDPLRDDRNPERVRSAVIGLLADVLALLDVGSGGTSDTAESRPGDDVAGRLFRVLAGRQPTRRERECLSTLVISLMDHGLTASTLAARVAASARASYIDCLAAAYATLTGPLHGGAPVGAYQLIERARSGSVAAAVGECLRRSESVPAFGHILYTDEDPRATAVFGQLWRVRGITRLRQVVEGLTDVMARRLGTFPNVDLANAATMHAFGMPPMAGEVVFQVARTVGVVAHVLEEYAEDPLRWRGRAQDQ